MTLNTPPLCPLCGFTKSLLFYEQDNRAYLECSNCDLLFTKPDCLLSKAEERARYNSHENSITSTGYVQHLRKLTDQLVPLLKKGVKGIDFGCGHTPVLAYILTEEGFEMKNYDPVFGPKLSQDFFAYDFLTATEVVEHFRFPRDEFKLISSLVRPGGHIAIMTNLRSDESRRSKSWWYLKDPTHRCFYSPRTFEYIGELFSWKILSIKNDVIIYQTL